MEVRSARPEETDRLAELWYRGWQDAHAGIVPGELARRRTLERFRGRMEAALEEVRVIGAPGAPMGFHLLKEDELYQLYVRADHRGSGVARALIDDAEARLAAAGVSIAWLGCAIGNLRAARFYEKCGWHRARTQESRLETPEGMFPLQVWRYEKTLAARQLIIGR